jgi:hypothetical protein
MAMKLDEKKGTSQVEVQPKVKTGAPPRVSKPKIKRKGFPTLKVLGAVVVAAVIAVVAIMALGGGNSPAEQANVAQQPANQPIVQEPVGQQPVAPPASGVNQPPVVQEPVAPPSGNTGTNPGTGVVDPPPMAEPAWQPVIAISFNDYGILNNQVRILSSLHGSAFRASENNDVSILFASNTTFEQWQKFVYQKQDAIHSVEGGSSSDIRASVSPVAWKQLTDNSGIMRVETVWKGFQGPGELKSSGEFTLQKSEEWVLGQITGYWKISDFQ